MSDSSVTSIHVVLDRSGSMQAVRSDVIGGFNAFVAEQQKHPTDAYFTLVRFDHEYEVVHRSISLGDVPLLDESSYVPRGQTALLDAIGRAVNDAHARWCAVDESARAGKVIFLVMTDGQENASREFRKDDVVRLIETRQREDQWEFVFIGADLDAIGEARALGFTDGKRLRADLKTGAGVRDAYDKLSKSLGRYRSQEKPRVAKFFDDED